MSPGDTLRTFNITTLIMVEEKGIEPSTVCLQGSLAPLEHAPPYLVEVLGSNPGRGKPMAIPRNLTPPIYLSLTLILSSYYYQEIISLLSSAIYVFYFVPYDYCFYMPGILFYYDLFSLSRLNLTSIYHPRFTFYFYKHSVCFSLI